MKMDQLYERRPDLTAWNSRFKEFVRYLRGTQGLNVLFATLCIIDLFGVFPIVALPGALISCGDYFWLFCVIWFGVVFFSIHFTKIV